MSVIGHYRKLKQVRRIIEDCMGKVHPVQYVKELMIKKELEKDPKMEGEDWSRFLPKFEKPERIKQKKKKIQKLAQQKSVFPNPQPERIIDKQMQSGEYFLTEKQKSQKEKQKKEERRKQVTKQREQERINQYQEPKFTK